MYRLANASSRRHSLDPGSLYVQRDENQTTNLSRRITGNGSPFAHNNKAKPFVDTESERRRLLLKLQSSSISNLQLKGFIDNDDEQVENKSMHSTMSVSLWWQRTRENLRKKSRNTKRGMKINPFTWRKKDKTKYDEMHQSQLQAFFETESLGNDNIKPRFFSRGTKHDQDDTESKSVTSQKSISSFLRPAFQKKERATSRKVSRTESFGQEFSVEVQEATTTAARPKLSRQGSSFIRRLLRPKQDSKVQATNSGSGSYSSSFPDHRLTPTTTDTTLSDTEEEHRSQVDDNEKWEEEPSKNEYESNEDDEDEDITIFFRPIEPHSEDTSLRPIVVDRWSPSPSPSLEHESAPKLPMRRPMLQYYESAAEDAPKLPMRRPMPDEEADDEMRPKFPISRKDTTTLYPAPSPIRAKPKPSWSGESGILGLIGGLVATFSDSSNSKNESEEGLKHFTAGLPQKGILKRCSITPTSKFPIRVKPARSVSFDSIFVREYERVLGDNPACGSGPPISIGWSYETVTSTSLEEYEITKPRARSKRELYLSASRRKDLLIHEWGFAEEELRKARNEAQYIQWQRSKSSGVALSSSNRRVARKPSADHSDTSQPSLRRETAERAARYSPTPEIMRLRGTTEAS